MADQPTLADFLQGRPPQSQLAGLDPGAPLVGDDFFPRHGGAFLAGLADPWGLPTTGLRGFSRLAPTWMRPDEADRLAATSDRFQQASPFASGAGSALLPSVGVAKAARTTWRELGDPRFWGGVMSIGGYLRQAFNSPPDNGAERAAENERQNTRMDSINRGEGYDGKGLYGVPRLLSEYGPSRLLPDLEGTRGVPVLPNEPY